jgi:hypothetical protein
MIKKMTIPKDEIVAGDYTIAVSEDGYAIIYREIPSFGTSAELNEVKEQLAKAQSLLSKVNEVAHQYFAQARRLEGLAAPNLAHRATIHGERILAALRGEELQNWTQPTPSQIRRDLLGSAEYWTEWLSTVTEERLTDGTPLLTAVFEQNPELAARLRKAIEEKK